MHINQFENLVNASAVNFMMISKSHKLLPKKKLSQVLTSQTEFIQYIQIDMTK